MTQIEKQIAQNTAATADSPEDAAVSPEVKALAEAKQTLIASTLGTPSLTRRGWAYCGAIAGDRWPSQPNLALPNGQEPQKGQSYKVTTDTYLRESPPRGSAQKGSIISVIPEGTRVKVLEVARGPDPSENDRTLIWVQVEYQTRPPLAS